MDLQVIVLAGTAGSRVFPLTEELPKALLPVANRPVLGYVLRWLADAGVRDALIVTTGPYEARSRALPSIARASVDRARFDALPPSSPPPRPTPLRPAPTSTSARAVGAGANHSRGCDPTMVRTSR